MRTVMINGIPVAYDFSVDELSGFLISGNISDFAVACEALAYQTGDKAFALLKRFITDKDQYQKIIF